MKKYFAFAAIACAALVSCQKEMGPAEEMPVAPNREGYVELTLSAQCDAETKAILDGNTVVWSVGDEVAVYAGDATTPEKFTVSAVDFDAVKFIGSVPAGATSFIAVYPFKQARGRDGNVVDMILPDWQAIPAGGNVCPGALSSVAYFADAASKPQFKNTFSLLEISFSNAEGITTAGAYCDCSDDEYYLGEMKVTVSTSGADPEIVTCLGGFDSTIAPEGGFTAGKSYYIVVPPTPEVKNFGIYANTDSKIARREKSGTFALARNKGISLGDALKDVEWKYSWIINGEQLRDFLAEASTYTADDDVTLGADIDMSGITVVPAASWAGRFSGNGYTIKNWSAPNALFATNSGVVEKVAIDNTCSINWTESVPDQTGIAFVVSKANTGTIRDCQVAGKIKVSTAEAGRIYCAGVVGESTTGLVEGCKFTGSIDVTLSGTSKSCSAIAGVAARVGTKEMTDVSIVKNCTNEGAITFLFSGPSGNMKKFGVGGVVGQTPSVDNAPEDHGTIEGCVNKGNISWEYTNGGSGSYPALGGVAGIIEGKIKDCSNYGALEYKGSKSKAATDPSIGGVAGYVTKGASGCHNYGTITLDAAFAGGTAMAQSGGNTSCAAFGGVFGCAGDFATGELISGTKDKGTLFAPPVPTEVLVENCSNEAALSLTPVMISSGGPKFLIGGVVGASTANIKDCDNTKDISIVSQPRWIVAGGIAGLCTGNMTSCTNSGVFDVDADKDNHPSDVVQQHYIGGVVGYIWKGAVIDECHNTKAVSLKNIFTTPSTLSYLGGLIGSYSGGITISNCSNSGSVTYDAQNPICLGGVAGAFNGVMTGTSNSGAVDNKSSYTASGKEAEVGGLVGYANAEFNGCSNTGAVSSASPDGATGGFVGGFGEAEKTWSDCLSDAPVSGPNAGSIFGWFRKDTEHTITLGAPGAPFTVSANATVNSAEPTFDNIVGKIKNGHTDNVNLIVAGKKEVSFSEDLDNNKFTYDGVEYPVVKLADGRWWMAKNLAFLPAGMTPATDLTAVTAGVFAPIKVTGEVVGFSTDPDLVASNGYLYQAEAAFGLQVGDLTSQAQAEAMEGTQGICPPGWYIPTLTDIMSLVGKTAGVADNSSAPYFGRGLAALNADGFNVEAVGAITIQDNTKTAGTFMGQLSGYTTRLSSSMILGSSLARVTYNTSGDASSGVKNMQFYGLMPMTNKPTEADYTCNGTMISYRIAGPLRCIRKP